MKRWLILLLAIPLVGCGAAQQQQQQLAGCIFEAENNYPGATWLAGDDRQRYVWLCMSAHGYILNRTQKSCTGKISSTLEAALYVQCYEPRTRFTFLLYKLDKALGR